MRTSFEGPELCGSPSSNPVGRRRKTTAGGGRNATRDDGINVKLDGRLRETPPEHVPAPDPDRPLKNCRERSFSLPGHPAAIRRRTNRVAADRAGTASYSFSNLPISNIQ